VAGARVDATVPIAERLLNEAIALALPPGGAVRNLAVFPQSGNRFTVRVKLARPEFLPPLTLKLQIERQPDLPGSAVIGFRIGSLPVLMSLAGAALSFTQVLPPGVRLDGDRLTVDLRPILERRGYGALLHHAQRLHIATEESRLVVAVTLTA